MSLRLMCFSACMVVACQSVVTGGPAEIDSQRILAEAGIDGGLVVCVGCEDARSIAALHANDSYLVQALETSQETVREARRHIRALGLYGPVSVDMFDGRRLPYADNLVNLLVAEDPSELSAEEVLRVLAPRGVALLKRDGAWTKVAKPWSQQMDEWTHFRHSAGGNMVSHDALIGPPRHAQWISGPVFQRHHGIVPSITTVVSSGGRMFYMLDEAPMGMCGMPDKWNLVARDAFNGVLLWERPMHDWGSRAWSYWTEGHSARFNHPLHVRHRLVAAGQRVYVTLGFNAPVVALDASTGKTVRTYDDVPYPDEFVYRNGVLYIVSNDRRQEPYPGRGVDPTPPAKLPAPSKKHICAVAADSGQVLWRAGPLLGNAAKPDRLGSMRHLNLTVGAKGVFCIDQEHIVGLDLATGEERWRVVRLFRDVPPEKGYSLGDLYHTLIAANTHAVIYHNDLLYVLHPTAVKGFKSSGAAIVQALSPETGEELWRHDTAVPIAYLDQPDIFGIGDSIWIPDRKTMTLIALDAATGKEQRKISIKKALDVVHHHRCYPNRASQRYVILGRRGAEFVDLTTGEISLNHWARSGCRYGHMLANGLFYRLPDHCRCYMAFQPRGFIALASEEAAGSFKVRLDGGNPLEKGPAYGRLDAGLHSREKAWPTFRHDPMRSSSTDNTVPDALNRRWESDLGSPLTAAVVAKGRVFCCTTDDHRLHALDSTTGKRVWSFTAGGRIDSPPTIHHGGAVFGGRDGWVYCLRASDGELAWRLRAAPGPRKIVAMGQLESAWPVHGSVLAVGDIVYFVAGRSSMLDTGIYAYAIELSTGKVLERLQLKETQTETKTTGALPQGALSDILTTDGENIYLRNRRLGFASPINDVVPAALAETRPRLVADGGFADRQWFHRAFWHYRSSRGSASGNLIAFDARRAYVAAANQPGGNNQSFHIPSGGFRDRIIGTDGRGPSWCAYPNLQYGGCVLFAARTKRDDTTSPENVAGRPLLGNNRKPAAAAIWRFTRFPLMPWAMVVAEDKLLVAGPADRVGEKDPWAVLEGRAGGRLVLLSTTGGEKRADIELQSPPVWNGVAVAENRVYVSTTDGSLVCLGE